MHRRFVLICSMFVMASLNAACFFVTKDDDDKKTTLPTGSAGAAGSGGSAGASGSAGDGGSAGSTQGTQCGLAVEDDSSCTQCMKQNCCGEAAACFGKQLCDEVTTAIYDCYFSQQGTLQECYEAYQGAYPGAEPELTPIMVCSSNKCATECF